MGAGEKERIELCGTLRRTGRKGLQNSLEVRLVSGQKGPKECIDRLIKLRAVGKQLPYIREP